MLMLTLDSDFVASLSEEVVALSLAGGEHSVMFSRKLNKKSTSCLAGLSLFLFFQQ